MGDAQWKRGNCSDCRRPVFQGRTQGRYVVLDVKAYNTLTVDEQDRYDVRRWRGLVQLCTVPGEPPDKCLRTHQCATHRETQAGGRLFAEPCRLCGMECWRGELVFGKHTLVNDHPNGEYVAKKLELQDRRVLVIEHAAPTPGEERFTPHWRLCAKLTDWRDRLRDRMSVRACERCGQPLVGSLTEPTHRLCMEIASIYTAAGKPYDDVVWAGLPGAIPPPKRRVGGADQCTAQTQYAGQCIRSFERKPEFTALYKTFCAQHNPARKCWRLTTRNTPCPAYTGDGRACEFHEQMPRLDARDFVASDDLDVTEPAEDEKPDVGNDIEPARDQEELTLFDATDSWRIVRSPVEDEMPAGKVATPWAPLNERLHGGLDLGQVVVFAAGDHKYASQKIKDVLRYATDNDRTTASIDCFRRETTASQLIDWIHRQIDAEIDVIAVDWFPNLTDPDVDAEVDEPLWRDDQNGARDGSEEAIVARLMPELHQAVARTSSVILLGACMERSAREVADAPAVAMYGLRGDGVVEEVAGTTVIFYPDRNQKRLPMAYIARAPMDVDRTREHFSVARKANRPA